MIEILKNIEGADTARRVGADALTPTFATLLPMAFPNAELVDAEQAMQAARRIKTPEEVKALRHALAIAEEGLAAGVAALAPEATAKAITAAVLEAEAAGGVSTPATQEAAWATSREHPWGRSEGGGVICEGDLVVLSAGVLADGYVAQMARTFSVGEPTEAMRGLYRRRDALWDRLLAACRPGMPTSALLTPTSRLASSYRSCRWRTASAGFDPRSSHLSCEPLPTPNSWRQEWCSPSPPTSGRHRLGQ